MKQIFSLIIFTTLLFSCKTTHFSPKTYQGQQIIAGSSGGITGMMKEYCILDNGHLFMSKGIAGDWREMSPLKRSVTKYIFSRGEELHLEKMKFRHPGNMTYYLILKNPKRSYEVRWGESGTAAPDSVESFYHYLFTQF